MVSSDGTSSCEYACWDVGCGVVRGGHVTGLMDDLGRASPGVPHTVTKGVTISIRLWKYSTRKETSMKGRKELGMYHMVGTLATHLELDAQSERKY